MVEINVLRVGFEESEENSEVLDGYISVEESVSKYVTDDMLNEIEGVLNKFLLQVFKNAKEDKE